MAEKDRRADYSLGHKADEDSLGYLQSQTRSYLNQPRAGKETDRLC